MSLPQDTILQGDCVEVLKTLPDKSIDLIFADPPYNLQLQGDLMRPNQTRVDAVDDEWDSFASLDDYDTFTRAWLEQCQRVLKDTGTIWVIGSYHNIFRVGAILMDLGYWIINDVVWQKTNPMPNFRGTRFTNATETMIWAKKSIHQKRYTFNYHAMKNLNDEKQMTNVWQIPICTGEERIKVDGKKAHSTQKPEALLYRVILSSSNVGDVVLDPFFGSGTTGAVAKKLNRHYIGIEREDFYIQIAQARLDSISTLDASDVLLATPSRRSMERVPFSALVESDYVQIGQALYTPDKKPLARVRADSHLIVNDFTGSIHKAASYVQGGINTNGWDFWHFVDESGQHQPLDVLRERYRATKL
jgi:site-specific DNA-methyltransferase (adenine-specific)